MSAPIKRYDAVHIRYEESNIRYGEGCEVEVVTLRDHIASHAYDEAVERAAFEAEYPDLTKTRSVGSPSDYWSAMTQNRWSDWVRCAKSRAKRAGGAE